ncbi:MAG: GNAT family N-acetyltransferase [Candidatus Dormiibacterota bacterium]
MTSQPPAAREIVIKAITESELGEWVRAMEAGFLLAVPDGAIAYRAAFFTPGRSVGAFAGDTCVATLRSFDMEVTVPGGSAVSAEGITNVAVVPARRRRGLLTTLMRRALDEAVVRGHSLAALIASEYRIYGRFGFGPATTTAAYDIDVRRAGGVRAVDGGEGTFEALSLEEVRRHGSELHERFRRIQPGAINRSEQAWRVRTGELRNPHWDRHERWGVLYRDAQGRPSGMALYRIADRWSDGDPDYEMTVDDIFAMDAAAGAALWRHLLNTEWVNRVTVVGVAPDDPLPLLLDNPRACVPRPPTGIDHLWLRILDVRRALEARSYAAPDHLVLEVSDPAGYTPGRFALETGTDGSASARIVDDPSDLALGVSALAMIYLGNQTFQRLAAAGLVTERTAGAVMRGDRMFQTSGRPWCADGF